MIITIKSQADFDKLPEAFEELTIIEVSTHPTKLISIFDLPEGSGLKIIGNSRVDIFGKVKAIVTDSAQVRAHNQADVNAYSNSRVSATDKSVVYTYDKAFAEVDQDARLFAYTHSRFKAAGNARVFAYDYTTGETEGRAEVSASGQARVLSRGHSKIWAHGFSFIEASSNSTVTAAHDCRVIASMNATVIARDYSVTTVLGDSVTIKELTGHAVVVIHSPNAKIPKPNVCATLVRTYNEKFIFDELAPSNPYPLEF